MKYRIGLINYDVEDERWEIVNGKRELKKTIDTLDVKAEFYAILRLPGVYKNGIETCDGVDLAKQIKESTDDFIDIEVVNLELLKRVFDKLIAQQHNPQSGQIALGGERYITLIQRVFNAEEVTK